MLDMIFVVENPAEWHARNMQLNPGHYSFIAHRLGVAAVCRIQEASAGVYFNCVWPRLKCAALSYLWSFGVVFSFCFSPFGWVF